jgi:hypothetical protein
MTTIFLPPLMGQSVDIVRLAGELATRSIEKSICGI